MISGQTLRALAFLLFFGLIGPAASAVDTDKPKTYWVNALLSGVQVLPHPETVTEWERANQLESTGYAEHSPEETGILSGYGMGQDALPSTRNPFQNRFDNTFTQTPALSFLSSGLVPGSAQAARGNWIRAGAFLLIEAASVYLILDYQNSGRNRRAGYEAFADENWSVVQYASWLVDYHDVNNLANPNLEALRAMVEGLDPAWNTATDWNAIDIGVLRDVERNTPYVTTDNLYASNFSHILPAYGSQQYYELIAKYYQFQAGWRDYITSDWRDYYFDYPVYQIDRSGGNASPLFFEGALLADQFNSDFRKAGTYTMLLIGNHIVSAFDAYFTYSLHKQRTTLSAGVLPGRQLTLNLTF